MRTSCNETDWVGRSLLTEVSHAHECTRGETDAMRADLSSPSIQKDGVNELDLALQDGMGACVMSACKVVPCLRADMRGGRHSSVRRVSFALGSGMIREGCGKGERAVSEAFLGVFESNTGSEDVTVFANIVGSNSNQSCAKSVSCGLKSGLKSDRARRGRRGRRGQGARARGRVRRRSGGVVQDCARATGCEADASERSRAHTCSGDSDLSCAAHPLASVAQDRATEDMADQRDSGRARLARALQSAWRRRAGADRSAVSARALTEPSQLMLTWKGQHQKRYGNMAGHVRYLQWIFRAVERLSAGAWASRNVRPWVWTVVWLSRRRRHTKCLNGRIRATEEEFEKQRSLANHMLDWYGQYVAILRRLSSGDAPKIVDDFCGGGLVAEGIRRAGCVPFGIDIEDQPDYKKRFSPESFTLGDGVDWSLVRGLQRKQNISLGGASPPCKWYSTARQKGESKQPPLIDQTRDMLRALFEFWWLENVPGARQYMSEEATEVDGSFFGLRVFRTRLFETNFKLHVDQVVRVPADALRARCCLGKRNRWRTFDEFGRPYLTPCCEGTVFVPIGDVPWKCTAEECARAMGADPRQMAYDRLAQGVPPAYAQWVVSQMCKDLVACCE